MKSDKTYYMPSVFDSGLSYRSYAKRNGDKIVYTIKEYDIEYETSKEIKVEISLTNAGVVSDKDLIDMYFLILRYYEYEKTLKEKIFEIMQNLIDLKIEIRED